MLNKLFERKSSHNINLLKKIQFKEQKWVEVGRQEGDQGHRGDHGHLGGGVLGGTENIYITNEMIFKILKFVGLQGDDPDHGHAGDRRRVEGAIQEILEMGIVLGKNQKQIFVVIS